MLTRARRRICIEIVRESLKYVFKMIFYDVIIAVVGPTARW